MAKKVISNPKSLSDYVFNINMKIDEVQGKMDSISSKSGESSTLIPKTEYTILNNSYFDNINESLHDLKTELNAISIVGENMQLLDEILKDSTGGLGQ